MANLLRDSDFCKLLEKVDADLAAKVQSHGCPHCGSVLHRGDYERKPRGGPDWDKRYSFCCCQEGCRKRITPPSVRFLGRKVYLTVVVVLLSAMMYGLQKNRVKRLQKELGVDRRTLTHWRTWWKETFVHSAFWKAKRALFRWPVQKETMPLGLVKAFAAQDSHGLLKLLLFLSPLSTHSCQEEVLVS